MRNDSIQPDPHPRGAAASTLKYLWVTKVVGQLLESQDSISTRITRSSLRISIFQTEYKVRTSPQEFHRKVWCCK